MGAVAMSGSLDWARQSFARSDFARRVCIVTDSASDILPNHARALGLVVVPNRVMIDGRSFQDGIDITSSQFYARLPHARGPLYTEPASANDLYVAYRTAFNQGATAIISIHVSSHLSKVVEHALEVRDYLAPAPIYVIDSQQAGIGMWPAVIRGAQLAREGAPVQNIGSLMVAILEHTRLYFMVETLEYLRRGGRIGRAQALIGMLLDAHPILTVDQGEVTPVETIRQRGRAVVRMRDLALGQGTIDTLLICGTSIEGIAQMEALVSERYNGLVQKTWLGPTLGANTGPGVAIAVVAR